MKKRWIRALSLLLLCCCLFLSACKKETPKNSVRLTFADSIDAKRIEELSGQTVEIVGYMATVSPVSGKYMYLMNLPYQSCPYCVPNTQQLSNTIAVYAKEGDKFKFYDGPINVVGTLETGDFRDEYGYTYTYRIANAVYSAVDSKDATEKLDLWRRISDAGVASDTYAMFDFLDFECNWHNYTSKDSDGNTFYLYPADADYFEQKQYAKEADEDFFTNLIARVEAIGDARMSDLIAIINDGQTLAARAMAERSAGNYTYDRDADRYTLTNGAEMNDAAQALYVRYAAWLELFSLSK